jgi:hypothetical protein
MESVFFVATAFPCTSEQDITVLGGGQKMLLLLLFHDGIDAASPYLPHLARS